MNTNALDHAYKNYKEEIESIKNEFNDNIADVKKTLLCNLLEGIGFKGIDVNIEESLFYYGMVRKDETLIMYVEGKGYYVQDVSNDDIENALDDMDDGFYSFLGISKEDYLKSYKTGQFNTMAISDIRQYNDTLTEVTLYQDKPMDIDKIINYIQETYIKHYNKTKEV